jgi:anti-anti-sigma factor
MLQENDVSITRHIDEQKAQVTIAIEGRFDFAQHKAFRDVYQDIDPKAMTFIIDLFDSSYLDSSALGMLLLLREYAGSEKAQVRIIGAGEDVRRVLKIANFEKLFILD